MELLVINSGNHYIKVEEDGYLRCDLDKASVFPLEQSDRVKEHSRMLQEQGFGPVSVKKLVITQEDFDL